MATVFMYPNGRLKIGRVTILVFSVLLLIMAAVFRVEKPVDDMIVSIKHVFEPARQPKKKESAPADTPTPKPGERKNPVAENVPEPPMDPAATARVQDLQKEKPEGDQASEKPTPPEALKFPPNPGDEVSPFPSLQKPRADAREGSVTVSADQYMKVFNSWRTAGDSDPEKYELGLQVVNLREAYGLFQMKPVAVVENRFYDLSDGSRIPEKALEAFSTTVFRVSDPWIKWGKALSSAGIKKTDGIDVRYHMYAFIRNAIYTRAYRAVSWCKDRRLIEAETPIGDLDVLGRAFVIKKEGGGRFGVFVPTVLSTRSGKTITIDSACFSDQPDVQMLKSAGLL